jgi:hypothetical protein
MNLQQMFGRKYHVELEEGGDPADPLAYVIPCRGGHIYAHADRMLAVATDSAGPVANRLRRLPRIQIWQDGRDGINILFDVTDFDMVAAVMHPRTRRRLSPKHKARLAEKGRKSRF